jgi:protein-S-isoprenylcysteine O-methyltransferase Ste14
MLNLKSPKGLRPEGTGPAFIGLLLPFIGAAIAATLLWPGITRSPMRPNHVFILMGVFWLVLGVLFWALSMLRFLPGFKQGRLVTSGTYGWCRHPIYASLVMFWLPAVGLIAETWTFYVVALIAWPLAHAAIRREETELAGLFGEEWKAYAASTNALLPLPPRGRVRRVVAALIWAGFAVLLLYTGVLRTVHLGWGATAAERSGSLPGDELVPGAQYRSTRVISINVPPDKVWPWLAQMGWDHGGLYSYQGLENFFGCRMKNADSIVAAWQNPQPGDTFRMDWRIPPLVLAIVDPGHAFVISDPRRGHDPNRLDSGSCPKPQAMPAVAWQFVLEPASNGSRLIARWQSSFPPGLVSEFFNKTMMEPIHFIMEERMLRGIKERAEGRGG